MNNFEHICEGGIDALMDWHYKVLQCGACAYEQSLEEAYRQGRTSAFCSFEGCTAGRKEWLEAEYVEPDTLERIIEDVEAIAPKSVVRTARWATEYCKRIGKIGIENDCDKCTEANCQIFAHGDIAARLRKVAENG